MRRSFAQASLATVPRPSHLACDFRKPGGFSTIRRRFSAWASWRTRIALACPVSSDRTGGDVAERLHAAPLPEPAERPDGDFLEDHDVRLVGRRQLHHALEVGRAAARIRVAVEDVPGADQHRAVL